jgi:hypothetical protein
MAPQRLQDVTRSRLDARVLQPKNPSHSEREQGICFLSLLEEPTADPSLAFGTTAGYREHDAGNGIILFCRRRPQLAQIDIESEVAAHAVRPRSEIRIDRHFQKRRNAVLAHPLIQIPRQISVHLETASRVRSKQIVSSPAGLQITVFKLSIRDDGPQRDLLIGIDHRPEARHRQESELAFQI